MKQIERPSVVDRLMNWSLDHPFPATTRYVAATLLVGGIALVRAFYITDLLPWLPFIPAIFIVGVLAGRNTGLYAVVLSAVLAAASLPGPHPRFWLTGPQWLANALYVLISAGLVLFAAELRASFRRARLLVTEREAAHASLIAKEEQSRLLNQELGHRLKNLLAVIQAVASQTLRQSPDLKAASDALSFRLASLGQAADVLTASEWSAADIHSLATAALRGAAGKDRRIDITGPSITLSPQISLALSLTFHELLTNAIKYGALSTDEGHVALRWSITSGAESEPPRFMLIWQEMGGPVVRQPTRRGFGSLMIERLLASYLRGKTSITYDPAGLVFQIDAPLAGAQA